MANPYVARINDSASRFKQANILRTMVYFQAGLSYKEMAKELDVTIQTVYNYMKVVKKIGVCDCCGQTLPQI